MGFWGASLCPPLPAWHGSGTGGAASGEGEGAQCPLCAQIMILGHVAGLAVVSPGSG